MELSATAKAILGIIAKEPRSGYEIKAFVDKSTHRRAQADRLRADRRRPQGPEGVAPA
jgi:hypothetical protein